MREKSIQWRDMNSEITVFITLRRLETHQTYRASKWWSYIAEFKMWLYRSADTTHKKIEAQSFFKVQIKKLNFLMLEIIFCKKMYFSMWQQECTFMHMYLCSSLWPFTNRLQSDRLQIKVQRLAKSYLETLTQGFLDFFYCLASLSLNGVAGKKNVSQFPETVHGKLSRGIWGIFQVGNYWTGIQWIK